MTATALASLLPAELCWRLSDSDTLPTGAFAASGDGAVLHLDVRGWRGVAELAAESGAEHAAAVATAWLAACCAEISAHGGDVVELCGDRIVAIWREEVLARAAARAVTCGLAIVAAAPQWRESTGARLLLATTVAAGDLSVNVLRDHTGKGFTVLAGGAVNAHGQISAKNRQGDVVVDAPTAQLLGDRLQGDELTAGCLRVLGISRALPPERLHRPNVRDGARASLATLCYGREALAPADQTPRLVAGASAVAVRLPALGASADLDRSQRVFATVSENLAAVGAEIVDLRVDAGGLTVTAMLAADAMGADRAAAHAVLACGRFVPAPRGARAACCFGVASGPLLEVTLVGERSARMRLGEATRLASVLAGRANGECLCDGATAQQAGTWVGFEVVGRWRPPDTLVELELHRPTGRHPRQEQPSTPQHRAGALAAQWRTKLQALADRRDSGLLVLCCSSADDGQVVEALLADAARLWIRARVATTGAAHRLTPAAAWRWVTGDAEQPRPQRFFADVRSQLTRDAMLETNLVILRGGEALDASSWRLATDLVAAIDGLIIAVVAIGTDATAEQGTRPTMAWHDGAAPLLPGSPVAQVSGQLREDSLQVALGVAKGAMAAAPGGPTARQGPEDAENTGQLVDRLAEEALRWRGWEDVVVLSKVALREDWLSDGRLDDARRRLRIGDAYRGLAMQRAAEDAYRQGLRALGKSVGGRPTLASAMPQALTRITGRLVSPWRNTGGTQEQALVDTLIDRLTNPQGTA
jgi:class 3 adenylate cyclase